MNKLVSESLNEYINDESTVKVNEAVDPATIDMIVGTLTAIAAGGGLGLALLRDKLAQSDNKKVKRFAQAVGAVGKSASKSVKGGSTSLGEGVKSRKNINEALDPAVIEMISILAGTIGTTIAVGGAAALISKLQKSNNPAIKKIMGFLGGAAKGAKAGVTQ